MRVVISIFALTLCIISGCKNESQSPEASSTVGNVASAQCMKDTDCKGDRICDKGICVSPTSQSLTDAITTTPDSSQNSAVPLSLAGLGSDTPCEEGKNDIPTLGSKYQGGIYLCREPVEIYWNEWYASLPQAGQSQLHVMSEGKTSAFSGLLTINCKTGIVSWADASDSEMPLATDQEISEIVPSQVIVNSAKYVCKG